MGFFFPFWIPATKLFCMHIQKKFLILFFCFCFLVSLCFSRESWIAQDNSSGLSVGVVSRVENMRHRILQVSINGKSCCVDSCAFVTNANEFFYFNGTKWCLGSSVDFSKKMIPVPLKDSCFSGVSFHTAWPQSPAGPAATRLRSLPAPRRLP